MSPQLIINQATLGVLVWVSISILILSILGIVGILIREIRKREVW